MTLELAWVDGGQGQVVETDGQRAVVRSSRAAPPGCPLTARVELASAPQVRLKVHGCRRESDGWFRIEARWVDLTRAMREEIVARSRVESA
jgi:hypothetical protein